MSRVGLSDPPREYDENRYVALGTTGDEVVIFDREEDSAWVKSTDAIPLEDSR